jgi:hypothetical protein
MEIKAKMTRRNTAKYLLISNFADFNIPKRIKRIIKKGIADFKPLNPSTKDKRKNKNITAIKANISDMIIPRNT